MLTFIGAVLDIAHSIVKTTFAVIKVSARFLIKSTNTIYHKTKELSNKSKVRKIETEKENVSDKDIRKMDLF